MLLGSGIAVAVVKYAAGTALKRQKKKKKKKGEKKKEGHEIIIS